MFLEDGRKKILLLPDIKPESNVEFLTATAKKEFRDNNVVQQF